VSLLEHSNKQVPQAKDSASWLPALFALIALIAGMFYIFFFTPQSIEFNGSTMGTSYSIHAYKPGYYQRWRNGNLSVNLQQLTEADLQHIIDTMSTYEPQSELMKLNRNLQTQNLEALKGVENLKSLDNLECYPVSTELMTIFQQAQQVNTDSSGMYDISVGPLVELWGFGARNSASKPPANQAIQAVMSNVGFKALSLNVADQCVTASKKLQLDLSSIAKGYAVDKVKQTFINNGLSHFLIEIGGEVWVNGHKPALRPWLSPKPWVLGIEQPLTESKRMQPLELSDVGLATSGDYRNFFEYEGRRYSHIINVKTGSPVERDVISATVLHKSLALADAYATALVALPIQQAKQLSESLNLATVLYYEDYYKTPEKVENKAQSKVENQLQSSDIVIDEAFIIQDDAKFKTQVWQSTAYHDNFK